MTSLDKNNFTIDELLELPIERVREFIANAEAQMLGDNNVQVDIKPIHHFSKSVYAREIKIPKGTFLVGKIHKHENLNILSAGELSIISIDGCVRVKAPYTVVSSPGVKRLAYAHEDSVWTTIHGTDETNLEKIELEFIAKDYDEVVTVAKEELCHG